MERDIFEDLERALAIDPDLGIAYVALARLHDRNWRAVEARTAYERARESSPNDSNVLLSYAEFNSFTGQHERAIRLAQRAVELDPTGQSSLNSLVWAHSFAGDSDTAVLVSREAVRASPTNTRAQTGLALLEVALGNDAQAETETRLGEALALNSNVLFHALRVAYSYARLGLRDDAARVLERIDEMTTDLRVPGIILAWIQLARGDEQGALNSLRRAAENRQPYDAYVITARFKANTFNDPILDRPEFVEVRSRLGFRE